MNNLTKFLHAMAEGIAEAAERIEAETGKAGAANMICAVRDCALQLASVADHVRTDGTVDWGAIPEESIGILLEDESSGPARAPVHVVRAPMREDGIYLFADFGQALAFADALTIPGSPPEVDVHDPPLNVGEGGESLIAIERASLMEDAGYPLIAERVRGRCPLLATLASFTGSDEPQSEDSREAAALLLRWILLDQDRGKPVDLRRVSAAEVNPGDWIALDDEGQVASELRGVSEVHTSGTRVHLAFADGEPGASFKSDECVWRVNA